MAHELDELFAGASTEVHASVEEYPWPADGDEFTLFFVVIPDADDSEFVQLPIEVYNVLDAVGVGYRMDGVLFCEQDIPTEPGLWQLRVKFISEKRYDWETGIREDDYGFDVLESKKI